MKLLITFSLVLLAVGAHAQGLIWSANQSEDNTIGAPGGGWQIAFDHVTDINFPISPSLNPITRIFSMTLNTNDIGRTFFANALNEPGFGGFVAGLTDGANEYLRFQNGGGGWRAGSEQFMLGRSLASPDLAGYSITQIGFRVNNFYDYFDMQEDRYFRQLDYSLDFYGAPVPEPGTWALLGLGSALLWSAIRRRRK